MNRKTIYKEWEIEEHEKGDESHLPSEYRGGPYVFAKKDIKVSLKSKYGYPVCFNGDTLAEVRRQINQFEKGAKKIKMSQRLINLDSNLRKKKAEIGRLEGEIWKMKKELYSLEKSVEEGLEKKYDKLIDDIYYEDD